ncbi:MAG: ATP-dependent Clp protease ATP-binding subunit ClpX, partial [Blautia sp.]|nr:ATP-dependent Clp protease ATP-binding subunit ClpX [Blautia sp.]
MAEKTREGRNNLRKEQKIRCSFCQKTEDQVRKMIAGPEGVFICDECVGVCLEILEEEGTAGYTDLDMDGGVNLMRPEEIHAILDDYVIGQ